MKPHEWILFSINAKKLGFGMVRGTFSIRGRRARRAGYQDLVDGVWHPEKYGEKE